MKKILYSLILCLSLPLMAAAQTTTPYKGESKVGFPNYTLNGEQVTFYADVDFEELNLQSKQMIELTPILRSTRTAAEKKFSPVVISGKLRARIIRRAEMFGDYEWAEQPSEFIVLRRKTQRTYQIAVTVPFEKWMRYSELVVVETCSGCGNNQQEYIPGVYSKLYRGDQYVFEAPYKPAYSLAYITPEPQPVKVMGETHSASLYFQVNKTNLLRDLGDNARILAEADDVINRIKTDTMLQIRSIVVTGYASPEGSTASNQRLSQGRAQAFVGYLHWRHNFYQADRMITAQGKGEDWNGLYKAVSEASYLDGQQAVLDAIDNIQSPERRRTAIRKIAGGKTYKTMLAGIYPALRRNEYTIEYTIRSFNREEAAKVYHSRPELLSLNEFFMVSTTMEQGSDEFAKVFETALRFFPESEVAQYNQAIAEIEKGESRSAISRLSKINTTASLNGLGVAYWHLGEYEKALGYLQLAANEGNADAKKNLEEYSLWFEDKD